MSDKFVRGDKALNPIKIDFVRNSSVDISFSYNIVGGTCYRAWKFENALVGHIGGGFEIPTNIKDNTNLVIKARFSVATTSIKTVSLLLQYGTVPENAVLVEMTSVEQRIDTDGTNKKTYTAVWNVPYSFWNGKDEIHLNIIRNAVQYAITGVDITNDYFEVTDDQSSDIFTGHTIIVSGSTGNDGTYTVSNVTFSGGKTQIYVNEDITDSTADGNIDIDTLNYSVFIHRIWAEITPKYA